MDGRTLLIELACPVSVDTVDCLIHPALVFSSSGYILVIVLPVSLPVLPIPTCAFHFLRRLSDLLVIGVHTAYYFFSCWFF